MSAAKAHRHRWLYTDKAGKPLKAWERRCNCGVLQVLRGVQRKP
jgi:hypothetical protein